MLEKCRFALLCATFPISIAACGGISRDDNGAGGSAGDPSGSGGNAGSTTGSSGGTGATGGSGSSGTGGSGGALPDRCLLPRASGQCNAAFPAYWHNPKTGVCEPFIYGGCGGNENRFETRAACQSACSGGAPDMDACSSPGDCIVASASCCGVCDTGTASSFVAIHRAFAGAYPDKVACAGVTCGPCPEVTEFERTSQFFIATCQNQHCAVVDVRETELTLCKDNAECMLRDGAQCCEGCDGRGLVALHRNANLRDLVCETPASACPPCLPPPIPNGIVPACLSGRCRVSAIRTAE